MIEPELAPEHPAIDASAVPEDERIKVDGPSYSTSVAAPVKDAAKGKTEELSTSRPVGEYVESRPTAATPPRPQHIYTVEEPIDVTGSMGTPEKPANDPSSVLGQGAQNVDVPSNTMPVTTSPTNSTATIAEVLSTSTPVAVCTESRPITTNSQGNEAKDTDEEDVVIGPSVKECLSIEDEVEVAPGATTEE